MRAVFLLQKPYTYATQVRRGPVARTGPRSPDPRAPAPEPRPPSPDLCVGNCPEHPLLLNYMSKRFPTS
ncbi:hypothetical protein JYU34_014835 [Plutella xylostella]|uniref:Uncharacterized protein n=1 Tax=Plutella xylostella TaxID=51655 RepID=A0ABQ7Q997_PLUXY|nr:hypothetical protein JYU34_014835 [Plutella xylostella]